MDNFTLLKVPASRISKEGVSLAAVVEIRDGDEDDEQDMKFDWERKRATQSAHKKEQHPSSLSYPSHHHFTYSLAYIHRY